ncbi:hypothetical protein GF314_04775 [bacterium]|nr:hypothetical protein [bacterium]
MRCAIATLVALALLAGTVGVAGADQTGWLLRQADLEVARLTGELPAESSSWDADGEMGGATTVPTRSRRSPAVPMLMSLVVPGAGEAFLGYKRGYLQIALDAASWYGAIHYDQKGEDKKDEYYAYADVHWSEEKLDAAYDENYLDRPDANFDYSSVVGEGADYFSTAENEINNYTQLPLWVSVEEDRREYYENLGKWDQFVFGWDDYTDPRDFLDTDVIDIRNLQDPRTSAHREVYRDMRQQSNDYFGNRDTFIYLSIAFRMFSVLQVAYLEGLLFGGDGGGPADEPEKIEIGGHEVDFIVEPMGYSRGMIAAKVSF